MQELPPAGPNSKPLWSLDRYGTGQNLQVVIGPESTGQSGSPGVTFLCSTCSEILVYATDDQSFICPECGWDLPGEVLLETAQEWIHELSTKLGKPKKKGGFWSWLRKLFHRDL